MAGKKYPQKSQFGNWKDIIRRNAGKIGTYIKEDPQRAFDLAVKGGTVLASVLSKQKKGTVKYDPDFIKAAAGVAPKFKATQLGTVANPQAVSFTDVRISSNLGAGPSPLGDYIRRRRALIKRNA